MSQVKIDKVKALNKWSKVLEGMGVNTADTDKMEWMAEYSELHSIKENVAYVNQGNLAGMGNIVSPTVSPIPGQTVGLATSFNGSGDYGQQLLPVAMKIAGQTIGLDLVPVKPSAGPKIDLMYIDFPYDDTPDGDEKPQLFKVGLDATDLATVTTYLKDIMTATGTKETVGGLTKRLWVPLEGFTASVPDCTVEPTATKQGVLEFLGFSRVEGFPMFRAYRQVNTASSGGWSFQQSKNTFTATGTMLAAVAAGLDATTSPAHAQTGALASAQILAVSALEDQITGYVSNFTNNNLTPMTRGEDDLAYPGVIAPKVSTKSIGVGTIEITSALKRTEIEDIKAGTGMDIVQKMETVLVNELSQTISKQIVHKLFEMGDMNRASAPAATAGGTIFDFNVTTYLATNAPGGETSHALQRRLVSKIANASNFIATEGRIGAANFVVTNGNLASVFQDIAGYTVNPFKSKLNAPGQLYPVGQIGDMLVYVDPYMKYSDNRILVGRKNKADEPGIVFIPYLMAQSITITSEATFAPRMLLRSRYAIGELGWYPFKQYMTLNVTDTNGNLI